MRRGAGAVLLPVAGVEAPGLAQAVAGAEAEAPAVVVHIHQRRLGLGIGVRVALPASPELERADRAHEHCRVRRMVRNGTEDPPDGPEIEVGPVLAESASHRDPGRRVPDHRVGVAEPGVGQVVVHPGGDAPVPRRPEVERQRSLLRDEVAGVAIHLALVVQPRVPQAALVPDGAARRGSDGSAAGTRPAGRAPGWSGSGRSLARVPGPRSRPPRRRFGRTRTIPRPPSKPVTPSRWTSSCRPRANGELPRRAYSAYASISWTAGSVPGQVSSPSRSSAESPVHPHAQARDAESPERQVGGGHHRAARELRPGAEVEAIRARRADSARRSCPVSAALPWGR